MYTIVEHAQDLDGLRLNVPETCECWGGVARSSSGCFLGLKMAIPQKWQFHKCANESHWIAGYRISDNPM